MGSWFGAGATRFSLPDHFWPCQDGFWKALQLLPTALRANLGCRESAAVLSPWPSWRIFSGVRGLDPRTAGLQGASRIQSMEGGWKFRATGAPSFCELSPAPSLRLADADDLVTRIPDPSPLLA